MYQLYTTDNHYWENPSTVHKLEGVLKEHLFSCTAGPGVSSWWIIRIQQSMSRSIRRLAFPNRCWWHCPSDGLGSATAAATSGMPCPDPQSLRLRLIDVNPVAPGFISKSCRTHCWQSSCPERTRQCPLVERALGLDTAQSTVGFSAGCCGMGAFIYPVTNAGAAVPKGQFWELQLRSISVEMCGNFWSQEQRELWS